MSKRNLAFLISAYVLLALIVLTSAKAASHRHSVNIRGGHKHPITDCSDLRIQFDERDAVMRSEEKTLTKSEAAVLQVHPHENGGVQVVGWDKDTYSVTACKAAAGSGDSAETPEAAAASLGCGLDGLEGIGGDHPLHPRWCHNRCVHTSDRVV
jgi:hypothetical protein